MRLKHFKIQSLERKKYTTFIVTFLKLFQNSIRPTKKNYFMKAVRVQIHNKIVKCDDKSFRLKLQLLGRKPKSLIGHYIQIVDDH